MKIAILGTGMVGHAHGSKLIQLGHQVMMGSRTSNNPKAAEWAEKNGPNACSGNFAETAAFGEIIFNCTAGLHSLEALHMAGEENLRGKVMIDISNPLDFSHGMPPTLPICGADSLGEQIQRAFPDAKVVKTLNTLNAGLQVNPALVPGDHNVFLSGDDPEARDRVAEILTWYGWKRENILDLGGIITARGAEMLLPIWVQLYSNLQTPNFNFHIVVGPKR